MQLLQYLCQISAPHSVDGDNNNNRNNNYNNKRTPVVNVCIQQQQDQQQFQLLLLWRGRVRLPRLQRDVHRFLVVGTYRGRDPDVDSSDLISSSQASKGTPSTLQWAQLSVNGNGSAGVCKRGMVSCTDYFETRREWQRPGSPSPTCPFTFGGKTVGALPVRFVDLYRDDGSKVSVRTTSTTETAVYTDCCYIYLCNFIVGLVRRCVYACSTVYSGAVGVSLSSRPTENIVYSTCGAIR
jgi:hypothetical protein